jgi:hypothetical protein
MLKKNSKDLFDALGITEEDTIEIGETLIKTYDETKGELLDCVEKTYKIYEGKYPDLTIGFLLGSFLAVRVFEEESRRRAEFIMMLDMMESENDPMFQ